MSACIKNGILYVDGKPRFGLGASYYPSFHEGKFVVPEDADRVGVMKKDFALMKQTHLNFVRCAALGTLSKENGEVKVDTPFIDEMAREAERAELGLSVRLNGYFVNLSGNTDYEFINNKGEGMSKVWSVFMQSCFFHEGASKDNRDATYALAKHFSAFPSVISYQIYNEPHYPYNGVYDYHPLAIAAYRKWLVERGIMTAEAAADYEPPRERPNGKDGITEWVNWREFSKEALVHFLDETAHAARKAAPELDTYTCYTASHATNGNADGGVTFFDDAKDLTTLAYTLYNQYVGSDYFSSAYVTALAESAAAVYGKKAWCAEMDARTHLPSANFYRSTLEAIGAGLKGIDYYEWRGDYPAENTPLPDNCGFLHWDGSKTERFDRDAALLALVDRYSETIVTADKKRTGIAILHSDRSYRRFDALSDPKLGGMNLWCYLTLCTYRELRKAGFACDFVRAEDLAGNKLGVRVIFVPSRAGLSAAETNALHAFAEKGGKVVYGEQSGTFGSVVTDSWWFSDELPQNRTTVEFRGGAPLADVLERLGEVPFVETGDRHLFANVLEGGGYHIVTLVNNHPYEVPVPAHRVKFNFPAKKVRFVTPEYETELEVTDGAFTLPAAADAVMLIVE